MFLGKKRAFWTQKISMTTKICFDVEPAEICVFVFKTIGAFLLPQLGGKVKRGESRRRHLYSKMDHSIFLHHAQRVHSKT